MFDKIWNFFSRLNYSHAFNLYKISNLQTEQKDNLKLLFEMRMKVLSDFRNAHMNIIAGLIALLGFTWKEEIIKNPDAFRFFMYFIVGSVIYLIIWYYADIVGFRNQAQIIQYNLTLAEEVSKKIRNFGLDKNGLDDIGKKELRLNIFLRNTISVVIGIFGIWIWWCFVIWIYFFLTKI